MANLLTINAFHVSPETIDASLRLRAKILEGVEPPASTLVLVDALPYPHSLATIDVIALAADAFASADHVSRDTRLSPLPALGSIYGRPIFSQLTRGAGLIFTQGKGMTGGASVENASRPWSLWAAEAQAEAILDYLEALLSRERATLADVVRAEITLNDPDDIVAIERVWRRRFTDAPPARTILPARLALAEDVVVEISLIAIDPAGPLERRLIAPPDIAPFGHEAPAVMAGEYLFLSTRPAIAEAHRGRLPQASATSAAISAAIGEICTIFAAAGGSLDDIVRRRVFTASAATLKPAEALWRDAVRGPLAPTTFALSETLASWPGATALYDVIGFIPSPAEDGR